MGSLSFEPLIPVALWTAPNFTLLWSRVVHEGTSAISWAALDTSGRVLASRTLLARADYVAVMAGDAQMDPEDLPRLHVPLVLDQADYTKGNRLFTGEAWQIIPRHRYLGNAVLSFLTKIASGYWHVADSQSGYTVIQMQALRVLQLERLYRRYGFPNHLLVELNNYNFRVRDVPIRPVYNIGETSGMRIPAVIPTLGWLLIKCYFWRMKEKYIIRDFHPLIFFLVFGLFLTFGGLALGIVLLVLRYHTGALSPNAVIFDAFCTIMGMQMLFFAMWMDMEHNKGLK